MSAANDRNKAIIEEFRANEGKVDGFFKDTTILLLHSTGAKSGKPRLNPVATLVDGDRHIVFASTAGGPKNPGQQAADFHLASAGRRGSVRGLRIFRRQHMAVHGHFPLRPGRRDRQCHLA